MDADGHREASGSGAWVPVICAAALGTPYGIGIPRMPILHQSHTSNADRYKTFLPSFSTGSGRPSRPNIAARAALPGSIIHL